VSTIHIVAGGEDLSTIAKQYGFKHWRVIYEHPRNTEFKLARPNPAHLHIGDALFIPEPSHAMEGPSWSVPVFSQAKKNVSWGATTSMLWHWRYGHQNSEQRKAGYQNAIGESKTPNNCQNETEMNVLCRRLGLRQVHRPNGEILRQRLSKSPVIISLEKSSGQPVVVLHYNAHKHSYKVINPAGLMATTFKSETTSCSASSTHIPAADIDSHLNSHLWHW